MFTPTKLVKRKSPNTEVYSEPKRRKVAFNRMKLPSVACVHFTEDLTAGYRSGWFWVLGDDNSLNI